MTARASAAGIAQSLTGPVNAAAVWSSISRARRSAALICSGVNWEMSSFFVYRFSSKEVGTGGREDGCC